MRATISDLKKGDVIIISTGSGIYDAKLLRDPQLAKTGKKTTWGGAPRWTGVICAIREETITQHYTNYQGKVTPYVSKRKVLSNGRDFNVEKRIDLSEKECWIIKREQV